MERTVSQIGPSTLMVSLPSKWARAVGIKKGDLLQVEEQGKKICFTAGRGTAKRETHITINKQEEFRKYVNALYQEGYDIIEISSKETLNPAVLMKDMEMLTGFELIKHAPTVCTITSFIKETPEEIDAVIKKLTLLNLLMAQSITHALEENQEKMPVDEMMAMESSNNKLAMLCKRMLAKGGYIHQEKTGDVYIIVSYLENIADELREICKALKEKGTKADNKILAINKQLIDLLERVYLSHKSFNNHLSEFIEKRRAWVSLVLSVVEHATGKTSKMARHYFVLTRVLKELERVLTSFNVQDHQGT